MKMLLSTLLFAIATCLTVNAQYNPSYAREVVVSEPFGKITANFAARLDVNTAELIAAGKMKADGSDIRFTPNVCADGSTYSDYFIEKGINTAHTIIWVRIPSITASGSKTLIMYYGEPSAASASNFNTTFPNALVTSGTGSNTVVTTNMYYGWIEVKQGDTITYTTQGTTLTILTANLIVNGVFTADGMGFTAPATANTNGNGPGGGTVSPNGNSGSGGGSCGGVGGAGGKDNGETAGQGGAVYGSQFAPAQRLGSSGGNTFSAGGTGGAGGGGIFIEATDITIGSLGVLSANGIAANGIDVDGNGAGGGSGGTIQITADSVHLNGTISVQGGDGGNGDNNAGDNGGGGGGGGRIILYCTAIENNGGTLNVQGGAGGTGGADTYGQNGGIGSVGTLPISFNQSEVSNEVDYSIKITATFDTICKGDYLYLNVNGNNPVWSTGETTNEIYAGPNGTTTYGVVAYQNIFSLTCEFSKTKIITVIPNLPTATITGNNTTGNDGSATVSGSGGTPPYTYYWSNGDTVATRTGLAPNMYMATVTDANGCRASAEIIIVLVGIDEVNSGAAIRLYPNPATKLVSIVLPTGVETDVTVELVNATGQIVYSNNVSSKEAVLPIYLNAISAGIYNVVIKSQKQTSNLPLLINTH